RAGTPRAGRQAFRPGNAQGMTIVLHRGIRVHASSMVASNKNVVVRWGLAGSVAVLGAWGAWGATGCSSSSSPPAPLSDGGGNTVVDAAQTGDAGLGFPVPDCHSCSATATCGGVLSSPDSGLAYCTQTCEASTDCPATTACIANFETPGL